MKLYYVLLVLCGFYGFETTLAVANRRAVLLDRPEPEPIAPETQPAENDLFESNPLGAMINSMISEGLGALDTPASGAVSTDGSELAGTMESPTGEAPNITVDTEATGFMRLNLLANENGTLNTVGKGIINFYSNGTVNITVDSVN